MWMSYYSRWMGHLCSIGSFRDPDSFYLIILPSSKILSSCVGLKLGHWSVWGPVWGRVIRKGNLRQTISFQAREAGVTQKLTLSPIISENLVTWSYLATREAGKCSLYGANRWPEARREWTEGVTGNSLSITCAVQRSRFKFFIK